MKAYGLFQGAAREDDLVAVVAYRWEDYREIFSGTVDDYKDFLLERKDFIDNLAEQQVFRVVEVPWDGQFYKEWLAKSIWTDEIDAHGAWALEVAKDRGQLRLLKEKYPALPAAPEDEEITVEVSYVFIPFIATSEMAFKQVSRTLPEEFLREVLESLRAEFVDFPFEVLSAKRGEGVAVMVGNRFITVGQAEDLAEKLIDGVLHLARDADVLEQGIISVPRQMRVKQIDEYPVFILFLLPVIFVGAGWDVDYAVGRLWRDSSKGLLEKAVKHLLEQFAPDMEIQGAVPIVPWYMVENVVDDILEQMEDEEDYDYPRTRPNLHRIK